MSVLAAVDSFCMLKQVLALLRYSLSKAVHYGKHTHVAAEVRKDSQTAEVKRGWGPVRSFRFMEGGPNGRVRLGEVF